MDIFENTFQVLITPAILISAFVYLSNFLGKVITDQNPFLDDRKWGAQLYGLFFLLRNLAFPGIVGIALAHYFKFTIGWHWSHLIAIIFIGAWLLFSNSLISEKLYQLDASLLRKMFLFLSKNDKEEVDGLIKFFSQIDKLVSGIFPILLGYILAIDFLTPSIMWLSLLSIEAFTVVFFMALNYSLRLTKLSKVDVYLLGAPEPMRGLDLLKLNEDNLRLRDGNKIIILNKDQVLKIETQKDEATIILS